MTKITLNDVGNLLDAVTAANTINANNATIVAAIENTFSRDGTQPNVMNSTFDMNSNPMVNLPAPVAGSNPLRLQDLSTISTITAATGTSGHVVPFLDGNNTFSGTTALNGAVSLGSGSNFTANGSVATGMTSLGPTGSHTTVQTWLTFKDNTGTTRYVPCF